MSNGCIDIFLNKFCICSLQGFAFLGLLQHLLILVTPRIIKSSDVSEEIYQQALKEAQRYDYFRNKYGADDEADDESGDDEVGSASDSGAKSEQG